MKPKVFIPEPVAQSAWEVLESSCECIAPWKEGGNLSESEKDTIFKDSEAVIVRLYTVDRAKIAASPRLKVIAKHGVGVDNIDVAAATEKRIPVVFTPTANANAVAEHAMTLMLSLARNVFPSSTAVLAGRFSERTKFEGVELAGKTLGVVGLGRIGRRVAEMGAAGFGMNVQAYDPFVSQNANLGKITLESSLDKVLQTSDFLSFHLPLTPETKQLLNAERLKTLKPECRIVNTSRGGIFDENALAEALKNGQIAGAALDVFEKEPLPEGHPFYTTPNMLLTPHISSSTKESLTRMARDAAQGVLDVFQGKKPKFPFNPEVLR